MCNHLTDCSLSQGIPIRPDLLGAHLEAYAKAKPIINALRLCNRFGKGEKAAITKLPAELLLIIESYHVENCRRWRRYMWTQLFKCWENRCSPIEHYSPTKHLELYREYVFDAAGSEHDGLVPARGDGEKSSTSSQGGGPAEADAYKADWATELNHEQLEALVKALRYELEECPQEMIPWRKTHESYKSNWQILTGEPTRDERGIFDRYEDLMDADFGLEIHISHIQLENALVEGQWDDDEDVENCSHRSTMAYIILGGSNSEVVDLSRRAKQYIGREHHYRATEHGIARPVAIPRPLSAKSLARFTRALKILDLEPIAKPRYGSIMTASYEDEIEDIPSSTQRGAKASESDGSIKSQQIECEAEPQLLLLAQIDDRPCGE